MSSRSSGVFGPTPVRRIGRIGFPADMPLGGAPTTCKGKVGELVERLYYGNLILHKLSSAVAFCVFIAAVSAADMSLKDGRVFQNARIVTIGESDATIVHRGGMVSVPIDQLPIDALARAKIEIEDRANTQKKMAAEIAVRDAEKAKKQKESPLANAIKTAPMAQLSPLPSQQRLIDWKQRFPPASKRRYGKIEVQVPSIEVWSYYHGMASIATIDNVPSLVAKLTHRIDDDIASLKQRRPTAHGSERQQIDWSVEWLNEQLRPYLATMR